MKKILLMAMLFVISLSITEAVNYGNTWMESCEENICELTLYSGMAYVQEEGVWKGIEQARSLKGYFDIKVLELDEKYSFDVIDYNYSCITIRPYSRDLSAIPEDTPIKMNGYTLATYKDISQEKDVVICVNTESIKVGKKIDVARNYVLEDKSLLSLTTKDSVINEIIGFGYASTLIELQDVSSENMADSYLDSCQASTNYGTSTALSYLNMSSCEQTTIMRFNTSQIPANKTIIYSNISFAVTSNQLDNSSEGFNISLYWVNQSYYWNETGVRWSNRPTSYNYLSDTVRINNTFPVASTEWTMVSTYAVNNSYWLGEKNITLYFLAHSYYGAPIAGDNFIVRSKEYATAQYRPMLRIVYENYTQPSPPNISCNESWTGYYDPLECNATIEYITRYYLDNNSCNTSVYLPYDNGSITYCCVNEWIQIIQPCTDNARFTYYTDAANCSWANNLPADNGTYVYCEEVISYHNQLSIDNNLAIHIILWLLIIIFGVMGVRSGGVFKNLISLSGLFLMMEGIALKTFFSSIDGTIAFLYHLLMSAFFILGIGLILYGVFSWLEYRKGKKNVGE